MMVRYSLVSHLFFTLICIESGSGSVVEVY